MQVIKDSWDIVIADISMPGRTGLDILKELSKNLPKLPVLILSMYPENEYAVRVIKEGGAGYLNKDILEPELIKAIETILQGRKYITPSVSEMLANELSNDTQKLPHDLLSNRELNVFKLIARGRPTGEIAQQLSISVNTVGSFRRRILQKMNLKTNADIVAYAIKLKLI